MSYLLGFILHAAISGFILWCASKLTSVNLLFKETFLTVCFTALVAFIPIIGWPLSVIVLFYCLKKYSGANVWPDLILMVIVSKLLSFIAYLFLPF